MKTEDLMDAFQYLDDDIIEAVDLIRRTPVKGSRRWGKYLAAAACICIMITAFRFLPELYLESDSSKTEDMVIDTGNQADNLEQLNSRSFLTLPDYSEFKNHTSENDILSFHEFSDLEEDAKKESAESALICVADVLPVYEHLSIPTTIFLWDELSSFEKELKTLTSYDIYQRYPSIHLDQAEELLKQGKYLTFQSAASNYHGEYKWQFVYIYDKNTDLAIPYYHFTSMSDDSNHMDAEKLIYNGYFVPAIEEKYITNMPSNPIEQEE